MEQQIREKIEKVYVDYLELDEIVKKKTQEVQNKQTELKKDLEGKSIESLEEMLIGIYVDNILYNKQLQILFAKLITSIELYKEFSGESLSEGVEKFYKEMSGWMPKNIFVVQKGELVETEKGVLDRARKEFLDSDFFKNILGQATNKPN